MDNFRRKIVCDNLIKYEAVDLGLQSGLLWSTKNVGAKNENDVGMYFAWGEAQEFDPYRSYPYSLGGSDDPYRNNTTLLPEHDPATVNMGENWRTPTQAEFQELLDNCTLERVELSISTPNNEKYGAKFTSKKSGYTDKYIIIPECNAWLYNNDSPSTTATPRAHVYTASRSDSYHNSAIELGLMKQQGYANRYDSSRFLNNQRNSSALPFRGVCYTTN